MKRLIIAMSVVLTAFYIQAQPYEKKAREILDKVAEKTKSYSSIKVEFTYTLENKQANLKESKKGSIQIKGDKYLLKISGQEVISNGKTIWTYIEDANEVQINSIDEGEEGINPTKLLTSYYEDYKVKLIKEESKHGKTLQLIDCVPLETKSFFKIRVKVNKKTLQIASFSVHDRNGSIYSYDIDSFVTNTGIPDARFTFSKTNYPAGLEVIDMR